MISRLFKILFFLNQILLSVRNDPPRGFIASSRLLFDAHHVPQVVDEYACVVGPVFIASADVVNRVTSVTGLPQSDICRTEFKIVKRKKDIRNKSNLWLYGYFEHG